MRAGRAIGTPTWTDLSITSEQTAEFYRAVFGWDLIEAGEGMGGYRLIKADGTLVGGMTDVTRMDPEMPSPIVWDVFLAVDDADARVARAVEHGGRVLLPPVDIGSTARHALIEDSSGARVGLWQAGELPGYDFTMAPGTPVWCELMASNYDSAVEFYRDVFDFDVAVMSDGSDGFRYATNGEGDAAVCGIFDAAGILGSEDKPYWRVYFAVQNIDAAIEAIIASGGAVLDGPTDSPFGRSATVADPEGATFQINESPDPDARA